MSKKSNQKKLRIACYAICAKDSGSVASANFTLLKKVLDAGHTLHYYKIKNYNEVKEFRAFKNFREIEISTDFIIKLTPVIQKIESTLLFYPINFIRSKLYFKNMKKIVTNNNQEKKYDLLLFLGTLPITKFPIKTLAWPQGYPTAEWEGINKQAHNILNSKPFFYILLNIYYFFRTINEKRKLQFCDYFIFNSNYTRQLVKKEINRTIKSTLLPYPIDTKRFFGKINRQDTKPTKILWLGRISPRKRLDLFLRIIEILLIEKYQINASVVGRFQYLSCWKKWLENFKFKSKLNFQDNVPQKKARNILEKSDILLQTSENENFGSSVAEAMLCGTIPIIGPTNGTGDYLPQKNLIARDYKPASFVDIFKKINLLSPSENFTLRKKLQNYALKKFDPQKIYNDFEKFLFYCLKN